MNKKVATAKTLAKKLSEKQKVGRVIEVQDIEDSVKFFSPVQTRQQRKNKQSNIWESRTDFVAKGKAGGVEKLAMQPVQVRNGKPRKEIGTNINSKDEQLNIPESLNSWEPRDWRVILDNIRTMRAATDAPVDTMGCHKCSDNESDEKTQRFQKLIALMLSSQTKDELTFETMQRLRNIKMTPQVIVDMERNKLEELLKPVSFYKNKAKYMQLASRLLIDEYDSDIPNTIEGLESLPGIGPKMAHICMATAWNIITGIGVDVHVHRIANRLNWLPKPTKEPEQTRLALEAWLPRDLWPEVNHLLVGFGQTICKATRPQCKDCLNRYMCPASQFKSVDKKIMASISIHDATSKKPKLKKT